MIPPFENAREQVLALLEQAPAGADPDGETLSLFRVFASSSPDCCRRTHPPGHFTGSAFVVSADGKRTLLMHHRKLDRWLQPGGHADGDGDLRAVALREAVEETGLGDLVADPVVFDLDRHWIPERKGEPGHWHYDVRFVVRATGDETPVANAESNALRWWAVADLAGDASLDPSLRRMARRWLAVSGSR